MILFQYKGVTSNEYRPEDSLISLLTLCSFHAWRHYNVQLRYIDWLAIFLAKFLNTHYIELQ